MAVPPACLLLALVPVLGHGARPDDGIGREFEEALLAARTGERIRHVSEEYSTSASSRQEPTSMPRAPIETISVSTEDSSCPNEESFRCSPGEWRCSDGCIAAANVCDALADCSDGSDEKVDLCSHFARGFLFQPFGHPDVPLYQALLGDGEPNHAAYANTLYSVGRLRFVKDFPLAIKGAKASIDAFLLLRPLGEPFGDAVKTGLGFRFTDKSSVELFRICFWFFAADLDLSLGPVRDAFGKVVLRDGLMEWRARGVVFSLKTRGTWSDEWPRSIPLGPVAVAQYNAAVASMSGFGQRHPHFQWYRVVDENGLSVLNPHNSNTFVLKLLELLGLLNKAATAADQAHSTFRWFEQRIELGRVFEVRAGEGTGVELLRPHSVQNLEGNTLLQRVLRAVQLRYGVYLAKLGKGFWSMPRFYNEKDLAMVDDQAGHSLGVDFPEHFVVGQILGIKTVSTSNPRHFLTGQGDALVNRASGGKAEVLEVRDIGTLQKLASLVEKSPKELAAHFASVAPTL